MGIPRKYLVWVLLCVTLQAQAQSAESLPLDVRIALATNRHADALPWLHNAADEGHPVAALTLGQLYRLGEAVPRDTQRAIKYLRIAEKGGIANASRVLSQLTKHEKAPGIEPKVDPLGNTPLHVAVQNGEAARVDVLLRDGSSITSTNDAGNTPLHIAAATGNPEICSKLIQAGADPNRTNAQGWSAVTFARRNGDARLLKLFNITDEVDSRAEVGLRHAVRTNQAQLVARLLQEEENPEADLLLFALSLGHIHVAQVLAIAGVGLDATDRSGRTALHLAAIAGDVRLIDTLLEAGADKQRLDRDGHSPLFLAARAESEAAAIHLAGRTEDASQALWLLADQGADKAVEALLAGGVTPDPHNHPIFAAAARDHLDVLKLFSSVSESARTRDGTTVLMMAAHKGSENTIAYLINQGAPLDTRNSAGNTALLLAAQASQLGVCQQLIDAGASLGIRNQMNINARSIMESKREHQWQTLLASTETGFFSNLLK